jgi:hypothetical protein
MKKSFSFPYFIVKVGFTLLALYITAIFLMGVVTLTSLGRIEANSAA